MVDGLQLPPLLHQGRTVPNTGAVALTGSFLFLYIRNRDGPESPIATGIAAIIDPPNYGFLWVDASLSRNPDPLLSFKIGFDV